MPSIPATIQDLWVTEDGTYGHTDIVLVDTSGWTQSDMEELESAPDSVRLNVAVLIAKKRESRWQHA
jgi:hypothetical protein